ncbi:MAG: MlaD family protein [Haloechinothrix sp.]
MRIRQLASGRLLGVALVAAVGATAGASGLAGQVRDTQLTVVAQFEDASPVLVGNEVKVSGVTVGEVAAMTVRDGKAQVALTLEPEALPVHSDAKVKVRPLSLLGERYLDLERGSPQAPTLNEGDVIPAAQTGQNTDLDEVLNTVDDPTGQSLAALVTMLGEGLRGNGENADATIKALASSMQRTGELAQVLNRQNELLGRVVDKVEPVAGALADDNGRTLDRLVGSTHALLGTTADNSAALKKTLAQLPSTLHAARTTLAELTGTAESTTPVLRSIRPVTDNLEAISAELRQFSAAANPALTSAHPVLKKAALLLDEARPVAAELSTAGKDVRSVSASLDPLVTDVTANLGNVLDFIRNWALATNGTDGVSHYLRVMMTVNADPATGPVPGGGTPDGGPSVPNSSLPLPGIGAGDGPAGSLLAPSGGSAGGSTGLTREQESGALQFLIGGQ